MTPRIDQAGGDDADPGPLGGAHGSTVPAAVTAKGLRVTFGALVALDAVSVTIDAGTSVAVIGPNGSGKSTLLRAVAGLEEPSAGHLVVPARARRGGVALVLQSTEIDRALPMSVGETVQMARYPVLGLLGRRGSDDRAPVEAALDRLELTPLRHRQLHQLSGGQRQRVLVAQGLAQDSELLLLDEPFTGLDVVSKSRIQEVIDAERDAGRTVVFSTHDLADAQRADGVLLLAGRQVAFGPPADVLRSGPLAEAFGGRMLRLEDGTLLVDDPHHEADHGHPLQVHDSHGLRSDEVG